VQKGIKKDTLQVLNTRTTGRVQKVTVGQGVLYAEQIDCSVLIATVAEFKVGGLALAL
jgi:exo-beta-1,3-glucanase (GH17 family)